MLGVIVVSTLVAVAQGFFYEVFSLAGVVLGYLLAAWKYAWAAGILRPYVSFPWVADVAGFLAVFLAAMLVAGVVARLARWTVRGIGLSWFDRILGAAFGLLRGVLVVTVVVLAVTAFAPESRVLARSHMAPYLLVLGRGASWLAPAGLRRQFRSGLDTMRSPRPRGKVFEGGSQSASDAAPGQK
jgi:membrane protein required for colicin V production